MEKNFKSIFMVLLAASAIFLISAVSLYFMRQGEMEKRVAAEKKLEELKSEKVKLAKDLEEANTVKNDLEIQVGTLEEKAKLLEGQLGEEKKSRETIYSQLESEKRESKKLVEELMKVKAQSQEASLNLANVRNECETLKTQLFNIQQAKEVLENKLKDVLAKKEIELERIVVKPEAAAETPESPASQPARETASASAPTETPVETAQEQNKGEILVVNKKFDFVVISLGENAGMRPGINLEVRRDGKSLARLEVEKVHASMSAAKIPPQAKNVDIREGDEVVVVAN
jgi:predicted  nucleic acid-binding Zn-ribbon protein